MNLERFESTGRHFKCSSSCHQREMNASEVTSACASLDDQVWYLGVVQEGSVVSDSNTNATLSSLKRQRSMLVLH